MISQTVEERGGRIEVAASMRKLTDHSPLSIKIWGHHDTPKSTSDYFDVSLLSDERKKNKFIYIYIYMLDQRRLAPHQRSRLGAVAGSSH
jgi:hypothetical protein